MSEKKTSPMITKLDMPGNSIGVQKVKVEKKKVERLTKGRVVKRKKSLGKKFAESFVGEEVGSVSDYIVNDILIPAAKNTILDMVAGVTGIFKDGIETMFFGSASPRRTGYNGRPTVINYSGISTGRERSRPSINRTTHSVDDIVLASKGEAEEVLSALVDLTIDYGMASVADLYDMVGVNGSFTDHKYGWTDLSNASTSRVRDGYLLNLPRVHVLD